MTREEHLATSRLTQASFEKVGNVMMAAAVGRSIARIEMMTDDQYQAYVAEKLNDKARQSTIQRMADELMGKVR